MQRKSIPVGFGTMRKLLRRLPILSRRFRRDEGGTASVEAVLWFPAWIIIFGLMVDTSMIYHGQSKVLRVVQDANRNMSIGRFTENSEVQTYIADRLGSFNVTPTTTDIVSDDNLILTTVTVPARQLQALGYFSALLDLELSVQAIHVLDSIDPAAFSSTSSWGT